MLNLQSSDSEDDSEDEGENNKFKTTNADSKDDSKYLEMSNQGSDSQQKNCDLHYRFKTLSPTPSCVIS